MNLITKTIFAALAIFSLNSCALQPIASQYDYHKNNIKNLTVDSLGNGKVLIYNGADALHTIDNTARLNVWIGDKALGQIRAREYIIVDLEKKDCNFNLLHLDMLKFKSEHNVFVQESTKVIRIEPTVSSNKLTVTNLLPRKFSKFHYGLKR